MGRAIALLFLGAITGACAHAEVRRVGVRQPGDPAWPRGEGRQIAWVGEIRVPESLGIEKGFLARAWEFVTGSDDLEGLYRPYGVAVDSAGRIAVADPGRRTVHLFDLAAGEVHRMSGSGGKPFAYPIAVAFLGRTLLVADADAGTVRAFGLDGRPAALPVLLPELARPVALAVDEPRGRLFVVDTARHIVHVLPLQPGGRAQVLGGRGRELGQFNFPTHLAVAADGRLAVCDTLNFRVQIFDAELHPLSAFGQNGDGLGDFARPKGIAIDREGVLFVLEGYFDVVQAFDPGGKLLGIFGGSGVQPGRFWLAGGMTIDARGRLYVADVYNSRVQVFDLEARTP